MNEQIQQIAERLAGLRDALEICLLYTSDAADE